MNARRVSNKDISKNILKQQVNGMITSKYYECLDLIHVKSSNDKQKYYLDIAAKNALKSPMGHKHGAIVVYRGKIIGSGYNYYISSFSIHAEVAAISNIKGKYKRFLQECELYVVRIGPDKFNNPLKYSKPCCNCQNTIRKYNIKKAFYSTNYDYDSIRSTELYDMFL